MSAIFKSDSEYGKLICNYFAQSFPKIASISKSDMLEILTTVLVGTKDFRYGPIPNVEGLFEVRKTIKTAINLGLPIPFLFPWGGRKLDPSISIDVAEVSAIKQIIELDNAVKRFYDPGIIANIRIEDINALWLYQSPEGIKEYTNDFYTLIHIMKGSHEINPIAESQLMTQAKYNDTAEYYAALLYMVIEEQERNPNVRLLSIPAYEELLKQGWKGEIPKEQRAYYLNRYARLYPRLPKEDHISMLANYFAGSKARYDLKGVAAPNTEVGSYIQGNFAHPVPGAPSSLFNKTLYYRTIPETYGRTHIAPWRSKGYLEIAGNHISPKVIHPGTEAYLVENTVEISDPTLNMSVRVKADYTVVDTILPLGMIS